MVQSLANAFVSVSSSGSEKLGAEEVREEQIMLGLRTAAGWNGKVIPEADWFIADEIISLYL